MPQFWSYVKRYPYNITSNSFGTPPLNFSVSVLHKITELLSWIYENSYGTFPTLILSLHFPRDIFQACQSEVRRSRVSLD